MGLAEIATQWGKIGCIGFGGPPAHVSLLRQLCVQQRGWLSAGEFEDGIAATNLLPGPASTQLAIWSAWRLRGIPGALVGGLCFILPGLVLILGLAAVFLAEHPPRWVVGAAAGAAAAVPVVAVHAAAGLLPASWSRAGTRPAARIRWTVYLLAGGAIAAVTGPWVVVVLLGCGLIEITTGARGRESRWRTLPLLLAPAAAATGGLGAVAWVAAKVGALSYGGGFVIIPMMQHDAVQTYHWMSDAQFSSAVALGQITPGPVVQTVAVVGYAAAGLGGALLAALAAFAPSFAFVLLAGPYFDRLRTDPRVHAFLTGASAAAIGAIAGSAIPLTQALAHLWQAGVLALAVVWLLVLRRGIVTALLGAATLGVLAAFTTAALPG
ncbi:chromate efflux transporter [Actinomadura macra]|uniref:chromate efflux transporter n=1 Tax=Actinomadura macra TaxID=46164 RepID=UPI000830D7D4|nr:chromate efflux transporter [Actinomadura macra]